MGLFGKRDPQEFYDGYGFTITKTLFDPPRLSMLPAIYQDCGAQRWSVRYPGAEPTFFAYGDVLGCEIVEDNEAEQAEGLSGSEVASKIIANPARASRVNAAKRNSCLGMGVAVAVRTDGEDVSQLMVPVITSELRRDSAMYERMVQFATTLKDEFDAMSRKASGE